MRFALLGLVFLLALTPPATAIDMPPPAPGAVISERGFPLKSVTRQYVYVRAGPSATASQVEQLPPWTFLFVLPPDASTPADKRDVKDLDGKITVNGFYRVSKSPLESDELGYVPANETVLWGHRQAVVRTPAARAANQELMVFETEAAAMRAASDGKADRSQRIGREFRDDGSSHAFFPVISQRTVLIDGGVRERVYEVMFFGRRSPAARRRRSAFDPGPTPEQIREVMAQSRIEIAFVIDTTGSMRPAIDAVRTSIQAVARHLSNEPLLAGRVRIGVVGYRDHLFGIKRHDVGRYAARVFSDLTTDFSSLEREVSRMEPGSGGEPAEDGLRGIEMAFDRLSWSPMAWKHVVVVTDASMKGADHPTATHTGARTLRSITAARHRAQDVSVFQSGKKAIPPLPWILSVIQTAGKPGDSKIATAQYEKLAGIHPRAPDRRTVGFHIQPGSNAFSGQLIKLLLGSFRNLVQILRGDRPPQVEPTSTNQLSEIPWGYLELLQDTLQEDRIHRGYATEHDHLDRKAFEEVILIRRAELVSLHGLLATLLADVSVAPQLGASPAIDRMLNGLQSVAAGTYSGEEITPNTPLHVVATQIASIPLQTDALNLSANDLARMTAPDRAAWVAKIESSIAKILRTIEGSKWQSLTRDDDPENVYTFVPLRDLP